ncbi:disks large-associated protein 5 [Synchiropus picturatus]
MESRFAHLRERDTSVSMMRVRRSRRMSQTQKENRDRTVNQRRQLDQISEQDISCLDVNVTLSSHQDKTNTKSSKNKAVAERAKQLERWRERKALEKEKEKREKERKGIFKTGVYHPKNTQIIISVPALSVKTKETRLNVDPAPSGRVTRSMKQQQVQKPLKLQHPNQAGNEEAEKSTRTRTAVQAKNKAVAEPARVLSTRSVNKPAAVATTAVKNKPTNQPTVARSTRSRAAANSVVTTSGRAVTNASVLDKNVDVKPTRSNETGSHRLEEQPCPSASKCGSDEDNMPLDVASAAPESAKVPSSFAPEGFVFEAPTGLSSFKFEPISLQSEDVFLIPRCEALLETKAQGRDEEHQSSTQQKNIKENDTEDVEEHHCPPASECPSDVGNMLVDNAEAEPTQDPSFAPDGLDVEHPPSPPAEALQTPSHELTTPIALEDEPQGESHGATHQASSTTEPTPESPLESKHDVPYFRSEISNETERLTALSAHWELKVEDESIPEEMRDRMRTAVGQARLLMKERFNQFSGLVDDCELQRGEKITTCTDLQGFWDMVYFQVEDVNKKFAALKEAEARGWVDEHKPLPRQRKVVKKLAAAPPKAAGTKAAARSRLAAVKAAMKARQLAAEAEKMMGSSGNAESEFTMSCEEARPAESPAKASGSVRRSSRLSAVAPPQDLPCPNFLTPRRVTRHSLALMQTQESPVQSFLSPTQPRLVLHKTPSRASRSQCGTPQGKANLSVNTATCSSPLRVAPSDNDEKQPETAISEENDVLLPEVDTGAPLHPSSSAVEEENKATNTDLCLSTPKASLAVGCCPPAVHESTDCQTSSCQTPDLSVVEDAPGLDFEHYLLPTNRCSMSPRDAILTASPLNLDVEMESPRCQSEGQQDAAAEESVLPSVLPLQSPLPQGQSAENCLLLFTPNVKDRIRESVCPSDLMVFTPPL